MMSNSFDFFDKIYCINLVTDHERKTVMKDEFDKIGIKDIINWKSAPRPDAGYYSSSYRYAGEFGCVLSHLKALIDANSSDIVNGIVVFEDDVYFDDDTNTLLQNALDNLPNDWDVLYLGGRPMKKVEHVQGNIYKVDKFLSTMSYCISAKALRECVNFYIDNLGHSFPDSCCDNILNDFILKKFKKGYAMYPTLTSPTPGWSTLRKSNRNYDVVFYNSWKENL
jgi:GR25 family glycosyltransferase involved in LPS biosynthesis